MMKLLGYRTATLAMSVLACSLLAASPGALAQRPERECTKIIVSDDSDYGPLHWYDGAHLVGASIDIVTAALRALSLPYEVRYVGPLKRVLDAAKNGEVDMLASLRDTPQRRAYLEFSKTSILNSPVAVFVLADRVFSYAGWNDLIGKKGGVVEGNRFSGEFDQFLAKNLTVEVAQKTFMNFKKLEQGSIDYLITGYYNGVGYLKKTNQSDKFVALKPYVGDSDSFVAMAKRSPCLKYLPMLDKQLLLMRQTGEIKGILDKDMLDF